MATSRARKEAREQKKRAYRALQKSKMSPDTLSILVEHINGLEERIARVEHHALKATPVALRSIAYALEKKGIVTGPEELAELADEWAKEERAKSIELTDEEKAEPPTTGEEIADEQPITD